MQPWVRGDVQPWAAYLWTHQLCRPFFKADGIGIRPLMCGEALYKYASACTVYAATRSVALAVGDRQYGAGRAGGAALELADIQAETRAEPTDALVSLDIKNAFGSIAWANALQIVATLAPKLAHFMACVWAPGSQLIWTQTADQISWTAMRAVGSLIQGGPEAHPVFCLVMAVILQDSQQRLQIQALIWAFVDDVTLKIAPSNLRDALLTMRDAMAHQGCELQPKKCHICIPALHGSDESTWPNDLRAAASMGFTVCNSSIPLLGSDAAVMHTITLQVQDAGTAPTVEGTKDRAARACHLLSCCLQLARSAAPAGGRWPALCITRDIACRALTYDARVLPCSLVLPHACAVAAKAWEVFAEVFGDDPTALQRSQAHLPTHLGGLSWPDLTSETVLARMANVIEVGPHLRAQLHARRPEADASSIAALDGSDLEPTLLQAATLLGVHPGPAGLPATTASEQPLRAPAPARHLQSAYLQAAGLHRFAELWAHLDPHGRTRLLSAGGSVAGQSLLAPPSTDEVDFNDADIRTLLRWRLGSLFPTVSAATNQGTVVIAAATSLTATVRIACRAWSAQHAMRSTTASRTSSALSAAKQEPSHAAKSSYPNSSTWAPARWRTKTTKPIARQP